MSATASSTTAQSVQRLYERFPYPDRDPAKETEGILRCDLADLEILNHYCFRGRRDFRRNFRALVAGGGTGDATIFLAHQLAGTDASIVHLDISAAAIDIARQRAKQRNLAERISFVQGSLFDLSAADSGPFDYIDCCGVLHHLEDPLGGLRALRAVLADDGAMGLMLYGRYGRTGVYPMQELLRMLNQDEQDPETLVANMRETFAALPTTNWLRRGPHFPSPDARANDTALFDMFLHPVDRPFTVPQLYDLLDAAGLNLVEFARPYRALYDPQFTFRSDKLRQLAAGLPRRRQQAAAEIFWGIISRHIFWASPRTDTVASPQNPDNVPLLSSVAEQARLIEAISDPESGNWTLEVPLPGSLKMSIGVDMTTLTRRFLSLVNGRRSLGEIVPLVAETAGISGSREDIQQLCTRVIQTLGTYDLLLLRHVSVAG